MAFRLFDCISLLCVVTENEEPSVNQVPEGEYPSEEVDFDICGSTEDPNSLVNQGKPRMHLNLP